MREKKTEREGGGGGDVEDERNRKWMDGKKEQEADRKITIGE